MIRIAAVGDLHVTENSAGKLKPAWCRVHEDADVLLLAGDLTHLGKPAEADVLLRELDCVKIPVVAVLGNHDHHAGEADAVRRIVAAAGVTVLEGESTTVAIRGETLAITGVKGFGGGFEGACGHAFGEPEMKAFMRATRSAAEMLEAQLKVMQADHTIALLHYAPVRDTLQGERIELYPFLGSMQLAAAADAGGAHLVLHGHAHHGVEEGRTPGGIPVRNVAIPVIRRAYAVYELNLLHAAR